MEFQPDAPAGSEDSSVGERLGRFGRRRRESGKTRRGASGIRLLATYCGRIPRGRRNSCSGSNPRRHNFGGRIRDLWRASKHGLPSLWRAGKNLMGFPESGMRLIKAGVAHARHQNNAHSLAWALGVFRFGDCHFATHFPARHARAARSCFLSDIQTRRLPHSRRRVVRNALRKDEQRLAFAVDGTPGVQVPAVETPP
jgi:hypothetical protein